MQWEGNVVSLLYTLLYYFINTYKALISVKNATSADCNNKSIEKQTKSGKKIYPICKAVSNFSSHLFLIASVSRILAYLKANLNSSAGIISHPGNWTGMENPFIYNFEVKINFQWKFTLYKILQSEISHVVCSIVYMLYIFSDILCCIKTSNHCSNTIFIYL